MSAHTHACGLGWYHDGDCQCLCGMVSDWSDGSLRWRPRPVRAQGFCSDGVVAVWRVWRSTTGRTIYDSVGPLIHLGGSQ